MAAELSVDRSQLAGWHKSFVDYWVGEGKPKADWVATWRNWMRREAANAGGRKNGRPLPMSDAERRLWELS